MTQMHEADRHLVSEIATYMQANPTLELGIDASTNPRATAQRDVTMRDSRVNAIRSSLIAAGIPASRISTGQFGNVDHRRDGRVEILLRTDRQAQLQSGYASSGWDSQRQGQYAAIENWTTLQNFQFAAGSNSIHSADRDKVREIADYIRQNPSLLLSIDSSLSANDASLNSMTIMNLRRFAATLFVKHWSLLACQRRISKPGTFSDPATRRNGRVAVLIKTDQFAQVR
jgi:outer membrane protein OmpA-like peptidoglycan-associated protein